MLERIRNIPITDRKSNIPGYVALVTLLSDTASLALAAQYQLGLEAAAVIVAETGLFIFSATYYYFGREEVGSER